MEFLEKKMYVYKAIVERPSPASSQNIAREKIPLPRAEGVYFGDRNTYKTATFKVSPKDGVGDLNIIPYKHIHPITPMY